MELCCITFFLYRRSSGISTALDETGIMGVVCCHEYPICFINLYHGEKLSTCSIQAICCVFIRTADEDVS